MPADTFEQLLDRASSRGWHRAGLHWRSRGRYHDTTTAAKQAILQALGISAGAPKNSESAARRAQPPRMERLSPPSVVCVESGEQELQLNLPVEALGESARLVIRREDGLKQ